MTVYKDFQKHYPKLPIRTKHKMKNFSQDDWHISYMCDSGSTAPFFDEDIEKVFDFYISYKDLQIHQQQSSKTQSTQPSAKIILDTDDVRPIDAQINFNFDEDDFFFGSSYQNQLSKKSSIEFQIKIPSLSRSQKIIIDSFLDDEKHDSGALMEVQELELEKISSYISYQEEVSILLDYHTDDKPKPKQSKLKTIKATKNRRASKGIRKGKNYQSRTQKFLKFMTHFHFSKNFRQFFNKGISNHNFDPRQFENYPVEKKIEIINLIIGKQVQEYEMKIHYSVQKGNFLKGFGAIEENVKDLFQQMVRQVYTLMFETCKRRIMFPEDEESGQGYLDRQAEKQFEDAFDEILKTRTYYGQLVACDFEKRLWEEIEG